MSVVVVIVVVVGSVVIVVVVVSSPQILLLVFSIHLLYCHCHCCCCCRCCCRCSNSTRAETNFQARATPTKCVRVHECMNTGACGCGCEWHEWARAGGVRCVRFGEWHAICRLWESVNSMDSEWVSESVSRRSRAHTNSSSSSAVVCCELCLAFSSACFFCSSRTTNYIQR